MKKLYTLAFALLASLAFTAPAHAFLIDGFGDTQQDSGGGAFTATADDPDTDGDESTRISGSVPVTDTDLTDAERVLTVTQEGGSSGGPGGSVTAEVKNDRYFYSQESGTLGTGTIDWTFDPETFSSPLAIAMTIIEADDDKGKVTFTLGSWSDWFLLPEVDPIVDDPVTVIFALTGFPEGEAFTSASLFIDGKGASALDLTLDFIEVPAPGVLGLLGIGFAGLAFAARRRRNPEADV